MGRILFFVLLALGIAVAWSLSRRRNKLDNRERLELELLRRERRRDEERRAAAGEQMVRCAHCGVYVPAGDALRRGEHVCCSPKCRDAGPRER